ncbi:MAG: hypothetical protein OXH39_16585 [Candidatus Poribacteria bacterium]|nr:hypothetical protein [Candidatus Poribacteria bacterium]
MLWGDVNLILRWKDGRVEEESPSNLPFFHSPPMSIHVCQAAGFQPIAICTPAEPMEDIQVKEPIEKHPEFDPKTYTDPILEECYRIKAELSAKFKTQAEFSAYLKAGEEEDKRNGIKYVSYYDPSKRIPVEKSEDND